MEPQFSTRIQSQTLLPSTNNLRLTHFIYWYICKQKEKKNRKIICIPTLQYKLKQAKNLTKNKQETKYILY